MTECDVGRTEHFPNKTDHFRKIDHELTVRYFVRVVYENTLKTHANRVFLLLESLYSLTDFDEGYRWPICQFVSKTVFGALKEISGFVNLH